MRVGIIQSNYIPWRGYFDLIDDVDLFIFLDDVKYTHRDWRNRNRIKTAQGPAWLTVPVIHDSGTLIQDARINYADRWVDKHIRSIELSCAKCEFYEAYADEFFGLLGLRLPTISALNVAACKWAMGKLGIETPTLMSSELDAAGAKGDRIVSLLKAADATAYLTGPAARAYVEPEMFRASGIALEYKSYDYRDYPQLHGRFEPSVSILDLLFNTGGDARSYLKSTSRNERAA